MKNKELIMLIGLPGSGKSTWAKEYKEKNDNVIIVSSDAIRDELGLENTKEHNKICFDEVEKRTIKGMKNGFKVIVDATNLNYKKRMGFLKCVCPKNEEVIAEAVVISTSYENCLKRNSERDRVVPEEVIKRMRENFNFPLFQEGFYDIKIVYNDNTIYRFNEFKDIEQDNPNHTKSVLEHCKTACCLAFDELCDKEIELACLLHDIGKLETKTFINTKGETTDIAHFYNHENVSAYNAMFEENIRKNYFVDEYETIEILQLINWHMLFHGISSEKAKNKYTYLLGRDFMNKLRIINLIDNMSK